MIKTLTFATAAALAVATSATAMDFPERPVNLVVPFNAGGGTDLLVRGFAPHFAEALDGDVFVSNMAGGSGTVAAGALAGQKPTGYQLGYWSVTVSTIQPQIKDVPYDVDSWAPICSVAASPTMLFTNAGNGIDSIETAQEMIEADPGKMLFGSSGPGAMTHLTTVAAFEGLGVMDKIRHLPFQGSGPALQAMAAGTIQFFGDTEILMQRGDFTPLMAFSDERLANFPDVPTATEVGIEAPLNELYLWGGLFAPAGTPDDVVAKLSAACGDAVASDGFQAFAEQTQTTVNYRDAAEFEAFFRAQYEGNAAIIDAAGL